MNTFIKLRLSLLSIFSMVVTSVLGQSEFSVDPTFLSFGAAGGSGLVAINNSAEWEAVVDKDDWVHLTQGTGEESHQLTVEVKPNDTGSNREAIITITDKSSEESKTIRVVQQAPELNIVEPATKTLTSSEQTLSFSIYSNVNWKVSIDCRNADESEVSVDNPNYNWLTIKTTENDEEKELNGSGENSKITLKAKRNYSSDERIAYVNVENIDYKEQIKVFRLGIVV